MIFVVPKGVSLPFHDHPSGAGREGSRGARTPLVEVLPTAQGLDISKHITRTTPETRIRLKAFGSSGRGMFPGSVDFYMFLELRAFLLQCTVLRCNLEWAGCALCAVVPCSVISPCPPEVPARGGPRALRQPGRGERGRPGWRDAQAALGRHRPVRGAFACRACRSAKRAAGASERVQKCTCGRGSAGGARPPREAVQVYRGLTDQWVIILLSRRAERSS